MSKLLTRGGNTEGVVCRTLTIKRVIAPFNLAVLSHVSTPWFEICSRTSLLYRIRFSRTEHVSTDGDLRLFLPGIRTNLKGGRLVRISLKSSSKLTQQEQQRWWSAPIMKPAEHVLGGFSFVRSPFFDAGDYCGPSRTITWRWDRVLPMPEHRKT